MKLRDCIIKRTPEGLLLRHATSSYQVRLNEAALQRIRGMLSRGGVREMCDEERLLYDKLKRQGIVCEDSDPLGLRELVVRERSLLESVELELAGACNLSCRHCFADLSRRMMSRETLDQVLQGVDELEPTSVVLNGGEPLLNPLFRDAVAQARARGLRVVIMTNGTLVTPDIAGFLAESRVAKLIVSLDFFAPSHDSIRGAGAFQKTTQGIRLLTTRKLAVFVTAMIREETAPLSDDFKRFCLEELGAAGIRFSAVMPIGKAAAGTPGLGVSDKTLRLLHRSGRLSEGSDARPRPRARSGRFSCTAGIEQCFVGADGSVYACHYFQNLKEPLGELGRSSLAQIHRAGLTASITSRFDWDRLRPCGSCAAFADCGGGCRARAKILSGSYFAPDPFACRIHLPEAPQPIS